MTRPQALFALVLAATPWLLAFAPAPRNIPRARFAPLFLVASRKSRRRRNIRRLITAAARSILVAALVLLWAEPDALTPGRGEAKATAQPAAREAGLRVLIVDASPERSDALDAADYLVAALRTRDPAIATVARRSLLDARAASGEGEAYDVMILADLAAPTEGDWALVDAFRKNHGAVVFWTGEATDADAWNAAFARRGIPALARNVDVDPSAPAIRAGRRTTSERLFARSLPDFKRSGLDALPIARASSCEGEADGVYLRDARSGAPIFTAIAPRLFWFGASPTQSAGSLGLTPSFPALAESVARTAAERDAGAVVAASQDGRGGLFGALWAVVVFATIWECGFARPRARKTG